MGTLFITGASGFIGRTLLEKLDPGGFDQVCLLSRGELNLPPQLATDENVRVVRGSLFDVREYSRFLTDGGKVVHLAALTGKARVPDYLTVNTEGTKTLLAECRKAGTAGFLYVSSISVKFGDISGYPYALSKAQAEDAVRESGIDYAIVRPTIVAGPGAPILKSLATLGRLPVVPMFGDGSARIQPVWVGDLANCLLTILSQKGFSNQTLELGGPEVISIEDFVLAIRELQGQPHPLRVVHLPLKPLTATLKTLEKLGVPVPFSAAQLSTFSNDGTAEPNSVQQQLAGSMKTVREMIAASLGDR